MVAQPAMYSNRNTYGSTTMASQRPSLRPDAFGNGMTAPETSAQSFGLSRPAEQQTSSRSSGVHKPSLAPSISDPSTFPGDVRPAPAIVIRKLPRSIRSDAVNSMLLFAEDLIDTEFVHSPYAEDHGFATVVARFRSQAGAHEAQQKLHGKPNMTRDMNMIVEIHSSGMMGSMERRATIDGLTSRAQTGSTSSSSSNGAPPPPSGRSRFGSTFQSTDKISPPLPTPSSGGSGRDFPVSDPSHIQSLFSPQSPLMNNGFDDRNRVSGKSFINGDGADDETRELLKDPVAYAKLGQQSRRATNPSIPVLSRFSSLSISTSNGGGSINNIVSSSSNIASPRGNAAITSPLSPTNITNMGPNGFASNHSRQFPPVNPADQNPPCNTLYVGNLPIDTSEDELKTIFSKQRGYKRLCFRTKQNGPMCFVEFEDVSFATKALNELYGHPLHNSIKGGIRLSFSKNPLGVRSGQGNGMMHNSAYMQNPMASAYANGNTNPSNFTAVSGPPPGLSSPPGLINGQANGYRSPQPATNGMDGMFNDPFRMASQNFHDQLGPRTLSGGVPPNMSAQYGRDARGSYTDYMLGR